MKTAITKKKSQVRTSECGYTLVEMLVVLAILGVLFGIMRVGVGYTQMRSRNNQRLYSLNSVDIAFKSFYEDYRYVPSSSQINLTDIFRGLEEKGYLSGQWNIPIDTAAYYRTYPYAISEKRDIVYMICFNMERFLPSPLYTCVGSGLGIEGDYWPQKSEDNDCQNPLTPDPNCGAGPVFWTRMRTWDSQPQ